MLECQSVIAEPKRIIVIDELKSLLTEVIDDEQLRELLNRTGFLVNVDYWTKVVKLHDLHCRFCNPTLSGSVKPSSKRKNKTGEFWYSNDRKEAIVKAIEISQEKGYMYSLCAICKP